MIINKNSRKFGNFKIEVLNKVFFIIQDVIKSNKHIVKSV